MKCKIGYFKLLIPALISAALFAGCQEKEIETFSGDASIYFYYNATASKFAPLVQTKSLTQSFFSGTSFDYDTLTVYVKITGLLMDYDRPIALRQTNEGDEDAAIEGVHFVSWDNEYVRNSMTVKANATQAEVKVIIMQYENEDDPLNRLDLNVKTLNLEVAGNEYFRPGIDAWQDFSISMTSMCAKPSIWDTSWKYYFGETWGLEKFMFIIKVTGITDWETKISTAYGYYLKELVTRALAEYNDTHGKPLAESDGTLVTLS